MAVLEVLTPPILEAPVRASRPSGPLKPRLPDWNARQRVVFRFVCAYLVLYDLPKLLETLPVVGRLMSWYERTVDTVAIWTGAHLLHLAKPIVIVPTGSGDTIAQYVSNGIVVVAAIIGGLVWTAIAKRREYRRMHEWLRIIVRFALAFILFGYGFAKIFPTQFPHPSLERLAEPIGELSPMGLLWTFMGYSTAYNIFTGLGEAVGALLLCFRRTTTAGALLLIAVMSNVVILNFAYDVPVKIFSANLLMMAVFLAAPDATRLWDLLIRHRSTTARPIKPLYATRKMERVSFSLRALLVAYAVMVGSIDGIQRYRATGPSAPTPPLFGIYDVQSMMRNGKDVPLLLTNHALWRRVTFSQNERVAVRMMNDSLARYSGAVDSAASKVTLVSRFEPSSPQMSFTYSVPDRDQLVLAGRVGADSVVMRFNRVDERGYPLMSRGFNWVQELPFNR